MLYSVYVLRQALLECLGGLPLSRARFTRRMLASSYAQTTHDSSHDGQAIRTPASGAVVAARHPASGALP